jgi:phosphatidylserine decarboxylase
MNASTELAVITIIIFILLVLLLLFWKLWFSRKPRRTIPYGTEVIASPANGRIAVVRQYDSERVQVKKWNQGSVEVLARDVAPRGWFVLIVMTPLNVHYQRAPITGNVLATNHVRGKFLNAVAEPERLLALENERNEILIQGERGRLKVVQIAGAVARRIRCFVHEGDRVEKGSLLGFIDLGSQVALILPADVDVKVQRGDRVLDGETPIAAFKKKRNKG